MSFLFYLLGLILVLEGRRGVTKNVSKVIICIIEIISYLYIIYIWFLHHPEIFYKLSQRRVQDFFYQGQKNSIYYFFRGRHILFIISPRAYLEGAYALCCLTSSGAYTPPLYTPLRWVLRTDWVNNYYYKSDSKHMCRN